MNKKKYFTVLGGILLVFLAVMCGVLTARFMVSPFLLGEHGGALSVLRHGDDENILVVGLDKVGYNTDVLMIVNIDAQSHKINLLSVPRDTRVSVGSSNQKINAVYSYAQRNGLKKEEQLISAVTDATGIPIHHYAVIDLEGFRKIIDALGGVQFNVERDYYYNDPVQNLLIDIKKGNQVLNGKQAEGLIRFRADYALGDLQRIGVQQQFLTSLISQKLRPEYIGKIPELYDILTDNVVSDLSASNITKYAKRALKASNGINTATLPGTTKTINGLSYFLCDKAETEKMLENNYSEE